MRKRQLSKSSPIHFGASSKKRRLVAAQFAAGLTSWKLAKGLYLIPVIFWQKRTPIKH